MSKATATLNDLVQAGNPCLICTRCGWWAYYSRQYPLDVDAFNCPDCKAPLDGVEKPVPST